MLLINKYLDGLRRWLKALFTGKKESQAGITLPEISVGLAVIAFLAIFIAPRVGALFGKTRSELAQQELMMLITTAQEYRQENGGYADIGLDELETGGYHIEPFGVDHAENTYGKNITLAAGSNGATAVLTYPTDTAQDCSRLENRLDDQVPITPSCAGEALTVTVN